MSVSYCQRHRQTYILGEQCPTCSLPENTSPKYSENDFAVLYQDNKMLQGELIGKNEEIEAVNRELQKWKLPQRKCSLMPSFSTMMLLLGLSIGSNILNCYTISRLKSELSWWKCDHQSSPPPAPQEVP